MLLVTIVVVWRVVALCGVGIGGGVVGDICDDDVVGCVGVWC